MVTDSDRFLEGATIQNRIHHAVKGRTIQLSQVGDKHPGLSEGKQFRYSPKGEVIPCPLFAPLLEHEQTSEAVLGL